MDNLITISNSALSKKSEKMIVSIESKLKELKEQEKLLREQLLEEMIKNNIIKFDTDNISITLKSAYDRENFDKNALRKKYPDIYDEFISMKTIAPSLTISVK